MKDKTAWDWQSEKKEIPVKEWESRFNWIEEPHVSPDGERIASIVNSDEGEFSVCVNGEVWEDTFEKAWSLRFSPDGRLAAFVANDEEWTLCADGEVWESAFDYIWGMTFSSDGAHIGAAIQQDGEYGVAVDGEPWETLYENINNVTLSDQGTSAAVVQVESMGQGDIDGFAGGLFSVAVNGDVRPERYVNIWDIAFDSKGKHVAHTVRKNRTDYSIFQKEKEWDQVFQSAWKPVFINNDESLVAPVRQSGAWYLFRDGRQLWPTAFDQLWKVQVGPNQSGIAAVASDSFGRWTVVRDDIPWQVHADAMIADLLFSSDGRTLSAIYKNQKQWTLVVNDRQWNLEADKLWTPAMDDQGQVIAVRFEKNGKYFLAVNGRVDPTGYPMLFDPEVSPDGKKILVKSISNGMYTRQIIPVDRLI